MTAPDLTPEAIAQLAKELTDHADLLVSIHGWPNENRYKASELLRTAASALSALAPWTCDIAGGNPHTTPCSSDFQAERYGNGDPDMRVCGRHRVDEALSALAAERAIARDRQPYPTAWAYERLAEAHAKCHDRLAAAEKVVEAARGYFVWAQGQFTSGGDAHDYLAAALARHDLANIGEPTAPTPAEPKR